MTMSLQDRSAHPQSRRLQPTDSIEDPDNRGVIDAETFNPQPAESVAADVQRKES